jgi:transcriptional regulator with XRE-family HTH domain
MTQRHKTFAQEIGKRIRAYRDIQHLSQTDLAAKAQLPRSTVRQLEDGSVDKYGHYMTIARALEIPTKFLTCEDPQVARIFFHAWKKMYQHVAAERAELEVDRARMAQVKARVQAQIDVGPRPTAPSSYDCMTEMYASFFAAGCDVWGESLLSP